MVDRLRALAPRRRVSVEEIGFDRFAIANEIAVLPRDDGGRAGRGGRGAELAHPARRPNPAGRGGCA